MPVLKYKTEEDRVLARREAERRCRLRNAEKYKANRRARYAQDPLAGRRKRWLWALENIYEITEAIYNEILAKQGGVCALCLKPPLANEALAVDHDHETKKVRGLLHKTCNSALGLLGDSAVILRRAADYLEKSRG